MGNILYATPEEEKDETAADVLSAKIDALEERIKQLENEVAILSPLKEAHIDDTTGIDLKTIDEFVERFMEKNPVDIGRVKPLPIPGLKNFEIDLMPPSVEKHLYSNIIALLLGFFDDEIQMKVANHRIRTIVSAF